MQIKPALVKELRERTGAGMMDCKNALVESAGDIEAAADYLRKAGQAKADKKASRIAAEGRIILARDSGSRHVIVEVNSETDFVANDENFLGFVESVASSALSAPSTGIDQLMASETDKGTLEQLRQALVAKVGENISVRRFEIVDTAATVGTYVHLNRIGVLVEVDGGSEQLARDLAMHIAATSPKCVSVDDIPAHELEKEREIQRAQAVQDGKSPEIVEKMVEGRLRKYFDEITLLGQPFVKDSDKRVRDLLSADGAVVRRFIRYEVGEGIQKEHINFADEVAALS
jgi:elongation factor Ts